MLKQTVFTKIVFMIALAMCAAEDSFSMDSVEQRNCDSLTKMAIDSKDNDLKDHIVQFDLSDEYAARNEDSEMCFYFLSKLINKIEHYKQESALRSKRTRGKPRKNFLKSAFHFKY